MNVQIAIEDFTYPDKVYTQSMYKTRICGDMRNLMSHWMLSFAGLHLVLTSIEIAGSWKKVVDALFEWLFKEKRETKMP
jgi:hypothetical protein